MPSDGPNFRFLDLPPELRDRIYAHLIVGPEPLPFYRHRKPDIAYVSQSIRSESLDVFYSQNIWTFQSSCENDFPHHTGLRRVLMRSDKLDIARLRHIRIEMPKPPMSCELHFRRKGVAVTMTVTSIHTQTDMFDRVWSDMRGTVERNMLSVMPRWPLPLDQTNEDRPDVLAISRLITTWDRLAAAVLNEHGRPLYSHPLDHRFSDGYTRQDRFLQLHYLEYENSRRDRMTKNKMARAGGQEILRPGAAFGGIEGCCAHLWREDVLGKATELR